MHMFGEIIASPQAKIRDTYAEADLTPAPP